VGSVASTVVDGAADAEPGRRAVSEPQRRGEVDRRRDLVVEEERAVVGRRLDVVLRRRGVGEPDRHGRADGKGRQDLEGQAAHDRHGREAIAVELRVQAVAEERLALVGVERLRGGEARDGEHRVEAEREAVLHDVLHEADGQVRARLAARALRLSGSGDEAAGRGALAGAGAGRAALVEPLRRDDVGRQRLPVRTDDPARAHDQRHIGAGRTPLERHPELLGDEREAERELVVGVREHRRVEVRRRRARPRDDPLEARVVADGAHRLDEGRRVGDGRNAEREQGRRGEDGTRRSRHAGRVLLAES
jgi:hypothetical protein